MADLSALTLSPQLLDLQPELLACIAAHSGMRTLPTLACACRSLRTAAKSEICSEALARAAGYGEVLATARPLYSSWRELLQDDCKRGGTWRLDIMKRSNWKHNTDEATAFHHHFYQNRVPYLYPDVGGTAYLVIDAYGENDLRDAHSSSLLILPGERWERGGPGTDPWAPCVPHFVRHEWEIYRVPPKPGCGHQVCLLGFELPNDENYAMLLGGLHFVYNGSHSLDLQGTDYECVDLLQSHATSARAVVTELRDIATFVPFTRSSEVPHRLTPDEVKQLYDPKAHGPDTPGWDLPPSVMERWRAGMWGVEPPPVLPPPPRWDLAPGPVVYHYS